MASAPWGHRTEGAGGWPDLGTNRPEFKSRPYCVSLVKALTALSPDSARLLKIPPADRGAWPGVPWGARHPWVQWLSGAHSKQPNAVVSSRMNVGCRGESGRAVGGVAQAVSRRGSVRRAGRHPPKQLMTAPLSARPQSLPQGHDTLPQDE